MANCDNTSNDSGNLGVGPGVPDPNTDFEILKPEQNIPPRKSYKLGENFLEPDNKAQKGIRTLGSFGTQKNKNENNLTLPTGQRIKNEQEIQQATERRGKDEAEPQMPISSANKIDEKITQIKDSETKKSVDIANTETRPNKNLNEISISSDSKLKELNSINIKSDSKKNEQEILENGNRDIKIGDQIDLVSSRQIKDSSITITGEKNFKKDEVVKDANIHEKKNSPSMEVNGANGNQIKVENDINAIAPVVNNKFFNEKDLNVVDIFKNSKKDEVVNVHDSTGKKSESDLGPEEDHTLKFEMDIPSTISVNKTEEEIADTTSTEKTEEEIADTTSTEKTEEEIADTTSTEKTEEEIADTTSTEKTEEEIADTTSTEKTEEEIADTTSTEKDLKEIEEATTSQGKPTDVQITTEASSSVNASPITILEAETGGKALSYNVNTPASEQIIENDYDTTSVLRNKDVADNSASHADSEGNVNFVDDDGNVNTTIRKIKDSTNTVSALASAGFNPTTTNGEIDTELYDNAVKVLYEDNVLSSNYSTNNNANKNYEYELNTDIKANREIESNEGLLEKETLKQETTTDTHSKIGDVSSDPDQRNERYDYTELENDGQVIKGSGDAIGARDFKSIDVSSDGIINQELYPNDPVNIPESANVVDKNISNIYHENFIYDDFGNERNTDISSESNVGLFDSETPKKEVTDPTNQLNLEKPNDQLQNRPEYVGDNNTNDEIKGVRDNKLDGTNTVDPLNIMHSDYASEYKGFNPIDDSNTVEESTINTIDSDSIRGQEKTNFNYYTEDTDNIKVTNSRLDKLNGKLPGSVDSTSNIAVDNPVIPINGFDAETDVHELNHLIADDDLLDIDGITGEQQTSNTDYTDFVSDRDSEQTNSNTTIFTNRDLFTSDPKKQNVNTNIVVTTDSIQTITTPATVNEDGTVNNDTEYSNNEAVQEEDITYGFQEESNFEYTGVKTVSSGKPSASSEVFDAGDYRALNPPSRLNFSNAINTIDGTNDQEIDDAAIRSALVDEFGSEMVTKWENAGTYATNVQEKLGETEYAGITPRTQEATDFKYDHISLDTTNESGAIIRENTSPGLANIGGVNNAGDIVGKEGNRKQSKVSAGSSINSSVSRADQDKLNLDYTILNSIESEGEYAIKNIAYQTNGSGESEIITKLLDWSEDWKLSKWLKKAGDEADNFVNMDMGSFGSNKFKMPTFDSKLNSKDREGLSDSRDVAYGDASKGFLIGGLSNYITAIGLDGAFNTTMSAINTIDDMVQDVSEFKKGEITINNMLVDRGRRLGSTELAQVVANIKTNASIEGSTIAAAMDALDETFSKAGSLINHPVAFVANKVRERQEDGLDKSTERFSNVALRGTQGNLFGDNFLDFRGEHYTIEASHAAKFNSMAEFRNAVINDIFDKGVKVGGLSDPSGDRTLRSGTEGNDISFISGNEDSLKNSMANVTGKFRLFNPSTKLNKWTNDYNTAVSWMPPTEYQAYLPNVNDRPATDETWNINIPRSDEFRKNAFNMKPFSSIDIDDDWFDDYDYHYNKRKNIRTGLLKDHSPDGDLNGLDIPYATNFAWITNTTKYILSSSDAEKGIFGNPSYNIDESVFNSYVEGETNNDFGLYFNVKSNQQEFYSELMKDGTLDIGGKINYISTDGEEITDPHLTEFDGHTKFTSGNYEGKDLFFETFKGEGDTPDLINFSQHNTDDNFNIFKSVINANTREWNFTDDAVKKITSVRRSSVALNDFNKELMLNNIYVDYNVNAELVEDFDKQDVHFMETTIVTRADGNSYGGKDLFYKTLIEGDDDHDSGFKHFSLSPKVGPADEHNIFIGLNAIANSTIQPSDVNNSERMAISSVIRADEVNAYYDELMINKTNITMENYDQNVVTDGELADPHLGDFKVIYNADGVEQPISIALQGKDLFARNVRIAGGIGAYHWTSNLDGFSLLTNLDDEARYLSSVYYDKNEPKNYLSTVKFSYRAKTKGPIGSVRPKFDDARFWNDGESNTINNIYELNDEGERIGESTISVDFSNSNVDNLPILSKVPTITRKDLYTTDQTDNTNRAAVSGSNGTKATSIYKNADNVPTPGAYSRKNKPLTITADNNYLLPKEGIKIADDDPDYNKFINTDLGIVRKAGEQNYGTGNNDTRIGPIKLEIKPEIFADKEVIDYNENDPSDGRITKTALHGAMAVFGAASEAGTDIDDNNTRFKAYGGTNTQIAYTDTQNILTEKKSDFHIKIKNKLDFFLKDNRKQALKEKCVIKNHVDDLGYILVYPDSSKEYDINNNMLFTIPFQFNPELSGETRSAAWATHTAIGRTNEFLVWGNTSARSLQFKTTIAIIAPESGKDSKTGLADISFKDTYDGSNWRMNPIYDSWGQSWNETNMHKVLNAYRGLVLPVDYSTDRADTSSNIISPPVLSFTFGEDITQTRYSGVEGLVKSKWIATDVNIDARIEAGYTAKRNPRVYDITMTLKEVYGNFRSFQTHKQLIPSGGQ